MTRGAAPQRGRDQGSDWHIGQIRIAANASGAKTGTHLLLLIHFFDLHFVTNPAIITTEAILKKVWKDSICSGYSHPCNLYHILLNCPQCSLKKNYRHFGSYFSDSELVYFHIHFNMLCYFLWAKNTARAHSRWCHGAQEGRHKAFRCCNMCQTNAATRPDQPMLPAASLRCYSSLVYAEMADAVGEIATECRDKSSLFKTK